MYKTPNKGTPISIPTTPKAFPPTVIANNTQRADNPIEFPTTKGYIKLPSICCITTNIIANKITFIGDTIRTINAESIAPTKAPKIGTKAVTPIIVLIRSAYGIEQIFIPIKHNTPNIHASITWLLTKFVNLILAIFETFKNLITFSFFIYAYNIFLI